MINLLPQAEKKQLRREYWLRLAIVVLAIVFMLEMFPLLLFVPTYYALFTSTRDLADSITERKALTPTDDAELERSLASVKREIGLLAFTSGVQDVPPSVLIEEIVLQKPQGIELTAFAYQKGESATLQVSGVALTQEDLLAFRRNIQANQRVLEFKYGSSFITQKANIPFSAAISFK
ncbi:MAG: hypothetical protein A3D65_04035 [Candidatus Lloydbacteria bacterium RIFCSPHIGHO2_02_FULL_50_13]|uniref:Uncharacterized protein n=1 Tax=Candidatus Lloydbacteria bacterium RIFCSPHIGHO2_02_FULL_50_13 TaxID=1798661 RepID=A0A1G2D536_9BACT|nr:MAG: hypothetical protein A3D65_04035 [Candidatus Lloydbacteria bacterium RIFCSPHIGHO2_02_FULL_50_13]